MPRAHAPGAPTPAALAAALAAWFPAAARDLPWRRTTDPYGIWISEIMLQQTQVRTVIPYWERWMRELPDIPALARASEEAVLKLWEGLGYYSRARNAQRAARQIMAEADGRFPDSPARILDLPGIGRYTAGAIASFAFGLPEPVLDGNVIRVLSRVFALPGDPRQRAHSDRLWMLAAGIATGASALPAAKIPPMPKPFRLAGPCSIVNQALMELGATVCTPSNPSCASCPLAATCIARSRGETDRFPTPSTRPTTTPRAFATVLWTHRGRWLLHRRPDDGVNAGFWEFPSIECGTDPAAALAHWLGCRADDLEPAGTHRHSITRYRITQHLFLHRARPGRTPSGDEVRWATPDELRALPLTGAHRRIAQGRILS